MEGIVVVPNGLELMRNQPRVAGGPVVPTQPFRAVGTSEPGKKARKELVENGQKFLGDALRRPEPLLTVLELAGWLRVKVPTIRKRVCHNRIPYLRIGRSVRFRRQDIEEWLQNQNESSGVAK